MALLNRIDKLKASFLSSFSVQLLIFISVTFEYVDFSEAFGEALPRRRLHSFLLLVSCSFPALFLSAFFLSSFFAQLLVLSL